MSVEGSGPEADKTSSPDGQRVEVLGRNLLVSELLRSGVEVARPERDHGIDLIAYLDQDLEHGRFTARPIQMKASLARNFSITRKYERFPGLLMVYIWYTDDPAKTSFYALSYQEAHDIAEDRGWLSTKSWETDGHYVTTKPAASLVEALARYQVEPGKWMEVVRAGRICGRVEPMIEYELFGSSTVTGSRPGADPGLGFGERSDVRCRSRRSEATVRSGCTPCRRLWSADAREGFSGRFE